MDRLLELLAKKKSKSLTPAEQVELSEILSEEKARTFSSMIDNLFDSSSELQAVKKEEINLAVENIIKKIRDTGIERKSGRLRAIIRWGVAAAAVIIVTFLGINYTSLQVDSSQNSSTSIVQTEKGSKSMTTLPDGTKVWINSDTRITYEKSFGEKNREVSLEGEAYFDVVADKNNPFIVRTKEMTIRVLGTIFNVRAYPNEANAHTSLIEGIVEVQLKNKNNDKITLKPNEKVIIKQNSTGDSLNKSDFLAPELTIVPIRPSWSDSGYTEELVNSRLTFQDRNLGEIIPVLERRYNVEIKLDKKVVYKRLFNGVFENENIEEVMQTLSLTLGFNYRINGNKIYIY